MKVEIDSFEDLHELSLIVVAGVKALRDMRDQETKQPPEWAQWNDAKAHIEKAVQIVTAKREPEVPEVAPSVEAAAQGTSEALRNGTLDERGVVETVSTPDKDGLPWDERIHSNPPKKNADGSWRARRGVKPETVAEVVAELMATRAKEVVGQEAWDEAMAAPEADETPAVVETHPLPTEDESAPAADAPDYSDLIEKATLIAGDQKDGQLDVLNAAKEFVKAHSPALWDEFARAVVPGKTIMAFEPGERRLILAAIEVYNAEHAS